MTFKNELANLLRRVGVAFGEIREDLEAVENQKKALEEKSKQLALVQRVTEGLSHDWRCSVAGHGQSWAWFFVRSFKLDENHKLISYDPFWARELIDDLDKAEAGMPISTPGKPASPYFSGPNLIGALHEVAKAGSCPECGEERCVVGERELTRWWAADEDSPPYKQSLYAFCVKCPKLTRFAHREDKSPVILHIKK